MQNKSLIKHKKEILLYYKLLSILSIICLGIIFPFIFSFLHKADLISPYIINIPLKYFYIFYSVLGMVVGFTISYIKILKLKLFLESCLRIEKIEEDISKILYEKNDIYQSS
ncbi:hypothetical protein [Pseudobacteroides cellulosolvens]|uniref:Uncharacterized protein n=1 Tax=Pseudobacteroides cellulosolvens ATCC 35603 = DSM 2933 TaxID=398512 RepID=A0A0L6JIZ0_9FIRM|nr:hypothetical protein [Pseudobacteroides cellulosolvens]KNY25694.1 hypothetical protein Bccel_0954 [Pseudobacteroides cellulosolvens ATCC 35603 = DSM 2933]KNY25709.1 hypothetical protein Bccel_0969 [Pseudobacteroides cellulosolvens ATCC 35603 = DSM 2933]